MLLSYPVKSLTKLSAVIFFAIAVFALVSGPLYADPVESADVLPAVLSDSDKAALTKEKAKLDELRTGLLADINQQNTECGQVAETNTFQIDLCRNRQGFLLDQIRNYKARLADYRAKIQQALFMAPQGKSSIQSGLVFKDIPPPAAPAEAASPELIFQRLTEYLNNPENHPRVKRAKEDADQFHSLHEATSKALLEEADRAVHEVRAKTVMQNPRLGREEIDRIVSQDPDVRQKAEAWYSAHLYTQKLAQDREKDYAEISKAVASELDGKGGNK